ncbi:hypothetical protein B0T25DRAFT_581964 [Lasiosphaeria hispida]|uniref:Uncharacterized protein n=1 Tax=Lasiosphaeria hispida TaxID=260671 RepID=A0AAJ0HDP4_9PEZI|nr:hypothetical protein B0T25DRAFT_581964 [Lasiosphaeria hispida]
MHTKIILISLFAALAAAAAIGGDNGQVDGLIKRGDDELANGLLRRGDDRSRAPSPEGYTPTTS